MKEKTEWFWKPSKINSTSHSFTLIEGSTLNAVNVEEILTTFHDRVTEWAEDYNSDNYFLDVGPRIKTSVSMNMLKNQGVNLADLDTEDRGFSYCGFNVRFNNALNKDTMLLVRKPKISDFSLPDLVFIKKDEGEWYQLYINGKFIAESKNEDIQIYNKILLATKVLGSVDVFETNEDQIAEFDKDNPVFLEYL